MDERRLRALAAVLSAAGIAIASYIAIAESDGGSPVCIAGSAGCQTVAESSYAEIAGVNVAAFGAAGYLALFISALLRGDLGRSASLLFSLIGFGFTAYLTYLELFVIDAICQWCVASAVVITGITIVNVVRGFRYIGTAPDTTPNMEP